jgi:copper chaperone
MTDPTHVVFDVPSVSCNHCKMAIESALKRLDGVSTAVVDVVARSVEVVYDGRRLDQARLEEAIGAEGYPVTGVHAFQG